MFSITYILSQVFIIISYVLLFITYQTKSRNKILLYSFISIIAAGLSYIFLSAYSGIAMVGVAFIRNIIFLIDEKINGKMEKHSTKDYVILAILFIIIIVLAIFTYEGILSMMSVAGTILYTYMLWQKSTKYYKLLGIPLEVIWLIYNIYIFSIFGIIMETILVISATVGYLREMNSKKIS